MDRIGGCQIVYDGTGPLLVDLPAPTGTPLCKNKEERGVGEGLACGRSDAKVRLFFERERGEMQNDGILTFNFLLTFHHGGGYLFITYLVPNLRAARILSHWIKYFLPLSNEILKGKRLPKIIPSPIR